MGISIVPETLVVEENEEEKEVDDDATAYFSPRVMAPDTPKFRH